MKHFQDMDDGKTATTTITNNYRNELGAFYHNDDISTLDDKYVGIPVFERFIKNVKRNRWRNAGKRRK